MVVYEKIYFKAYTNDQYTSHKKNIVQLYFYIRESRAMLALFQLT